NIQNTISNLLVNNAQELNQIKKSQKRYSDPYVANNIVNFILNIDCLNSEVTMPDISLGFIKSRNKSILYKCLKKLKVSLLLRDY
ncbi:UDP-N-acetylglucosamine--LPS N-acetylglucosamine transferase, partial [Clostridium sp. WILCCON 0269]